ncbi:FAD-binding protein [Kerstersia sp.]|uniref:FAD-binding protein n=1 Tax=Kerstersia sp. TaxID=1930783 RepID=UPI003F9148A6
MASYPSSNLIQPGSHDHEYRADILVIGGSVAGCWAALSARSAGASVILAEKGVVGEAGVVAKASGSACYTRPGETAYNDKLIHSRHAAACGLDDLAYIERIYEESYRIGLQLKALGFQSAYGLPTLDGSPPSLLAFQGPYALLFLREQLLQAGVCILDRSPALELLDRDGTVAGAAGYNTKDGSNWSVRAGAVILATGGNAFLSGAMGTEGTTGDGHLMAAEAGATFSGLEFSGHYGLSPQGSPTTKGFWYSSATFYDGNGRELPANGWESVADVGRAILETGAAYASMNRGNPHLKAFAKTVSSIYEHFRAIGVDPFTERFPLELRYEGLIRAAGGLTTDANSATTVPGLYAAGDVTERTHLCGAAMSGAGPAIAWCLVSAKWAAQAAVAAARPAPPDNLALRGLGGIGLRSDKAASAAPSATIRQAVQAEILPIEKNVFRTLSGIQASLAQLDTLWDQADSGLIPASGQNPRHTRETAAMLAGARWIYRSASERRETRGLHRLQELPQADPAQQDRILVSGLGDIRLQRVALTPSSTAPQPA